MAVVVAQFHPVGDSYSASLCDAVLDGLNGAAVRCVRLGSGDDLTAETFAGADRLIAVYPTWYGSLPAAFLAPLDETIGPWVDGDEPAETSPLRSVRSVTAITTHGSSRLVNRLQGEPGLHLWKRTVLPLCAPGATFDWKALYKLDRNTAADRDAFIAEVAQVAAG